MLLLFIALVQLAAPTLGSPVAPWWAAPVERIAIAWGQAMIVACVPVGATVIRGLISHREHKETKADVADLKRTIENGNGKVH